MKVYNTDHNQPLKPELKNLLASFRRKRGFNAKSYAEAKAALINDYFKDTPLKTAIIALSGGIDSSVVAGLVAYAMKQDKSPIENILTPTIPAFATGATRQSDSIQRAYDVMDAIGSERVVIDITKPHKVLTETVEKTLGLTGDDWAKGQSVAHVRTMSLAYCATLMQMQNRSGILIGTTNRDEGAYLGYVGKYSDGLVDLQVISDLHKSEVYALAEFLKLPESTIKAIPRGDMYDDRVDTEVFGAPYDFVELYLNFLELTEEKQQEILTSFPEEARAQFDAMRGNLEKLHGYNAHKYLGNQPGSPAYHLDLLRSGVPSGWSDTVATPKDQEPPKAIKETMPGYFENEISSDMFLPHHQPEVISLDLKGSCDYRDQQAYVVEKLLTPLEVKVVTDIANKAQSWIPVGEDGMRQNFSLLSDDKIGSWRATTFSTVFSKVIWERLQPLLPAFEYIKKGTSLDAQDAEVWKAVGVNSKLSFILYRPDDSGNLVAHYDAPFDYGDGRRTLKSLVMYFNDAGLEQGGRTRFIKDPQATTLPLERELSDWDRNADESEVIYTRTPKAGNALIFNHRVLHDSEPLAQDSKPKLIIRSDIIYQKVKAP